MLFMIKEPLSTQVHCRSIEPQSHSMMSQKQDVNEKVCMSMTCEKFRKLKF